MKPIAVIATTISGSVSDWSKVDRIGDAFRAAGLPAVEVHTVDSHADARVSARQLTAAGARTVISAGGSGTFNAVLEGALDAGPLSGDFRLGFLRKGSADLIGKALGMPDDLTDAAGVFAAAVRDDRHVACDVLEVSTPGAPARRFAGYGGYGLFGEIPRYTENRWMKYYKGVLSQLFGDLGPFTVGTLLAVCGRTFRRPLRLTLEADGHVYAPERYQAVILANGYLGPEMPFAKGVPLGSGDFRVFLLRDRGAWRLPGQLRRAFKGTITDDPTRWGWEAIKVTDLLTVCSPDGGTFPMNVDGSTLCCDGTCSVRLAGQVQLLVASGLAGQGLRSGEYGDA